MELSKEDLADLTTIAVRAAEEAGRLISHYTSEDFEIIQKDSGNSAVSQALTEVDFLSQEVILRHLKPTCESYDLGLLTEEQEDDGSRLIKDAFWCIDPIDGTLCFIEKRRGYAVSIALVSKSGEPLIGVVYEPRTATLYHAFKGHGAYCNHEPWQPSLEVSEDSRQIKEGGSVMNGVWVLESSPAFFLKKPKPENGGGCLWDYAATGCIYNEVGAWMSDMSGKKIDLNSTESLHMNRHGILLASNAKIAKQVLDRNSNDR